MPAGGASEPLTRGRWRAVRLVALVTLVALLSAGCRSVDEAPPPAAAPQAPATASPSDRPADDTSAAGPKVAFLGDSISAGLHLSADQAFPAVLQRDLAARGVRFQLLNAGVSGDTTAGGLRRVDWILKQSPAIVVIELGGNDGLRGLPVESIEQNLRAIVQKVRARGASALLLGMRLPPSYGAPYVEQFEALYPRLARELEVPFVPFFMDGVAGVAAMNLPDGLHPTADGHVRLAAALRQPVEQLIAVAGQGASVSAPSSPLR
jgi:acyl-CoA thioesterase-1